MNARTSRKGSTVVYNTDGALVSGYGFQVVDCTATDVLHRFGPWPLGYNGAVDASQQYIPQQQLLLMGGIQRQNPTGAYDPIDPGNPGLIAFNIYLELQPFQEGQRGALPRGVSPVRIPVGNNNQNLTAAAAATVATPVGRQALIPFPLGPAAVSLSLVQSVPGGAFQISQGFLLWAAVPMSWRPSPA